MRSTECHSSYNSCIKDATTSLRITFVCDMARHPNWPCYGTVLSVSLSVCLFRTDP